MFFYPDKHIQKRTANPMYNLLVVLMDLITASNESTTGADASVEAVKLYHGT